MVVRKDDNLEEVRELFEFHPNFYNINAFICVVFGAALGAYIGFQFTGYGNNYKTFLSLLFTLAAGNGFVLSLLQLGSRVATRGVRASTKLAIVSLFWTAMLIALAQMLLNQGWIFAGIIVPWWFATLLHAALIRMAFGKADE